MTTTASTAPATVWLPDTSSLISMAVAPGIGQAVRAEMQDAQVRLTITVRNELEYRASRSETATLARRAIDDLDPTWSTIDTSFLTEQEIQAVQQEVRDGRTLTDGYQHWAESTIILLGRQACDRGSSLKIYFLTEDYDARRVAVGVAGMTPQSIHRLLYERVKGGRMSAGAAATLSATLHAAGRGPDITEAEFKKESRSGLGRVGQP